MNILYIAFSCDPNKGSESKIGWNIPLESAKTNCVHVITKEEHREAIEAYLREHTVQNIRFYFVDIPQVYKVLYPKGFFYSGRMNIWHRRAFPLAEKICREAKIDVIHQITPIEFRSVGDYGKIPGVQFVCGPLGGGEYIPKGLRSYAAAQMPLEWLRSGVNRWHRFRLKRTRRLESCSCVLFANEETRRYLDPILPPGEHREVMSEIASDDAAYGYRDRTKPETVCSFLVAGRLVYRKGHAFLLDALAQLPEEQAWQCRIVGEGPAMKKLKKRCAGNFPADRIEFTGKLLYNEMNTEYCRANVLVMPSIRETTGSVLLEAMSRGIPVVTINRFGGALLLNAETGWLYDGSTRETYITNLKDALLQCIAQPDEVRRRGENAAAQARKYTWNAKMEHYNSIYHTLCGQAEAQI